MNVSIWTVLEAFGIMCVVWFLVGFIKGLLGKK